jgi:hypothetical protein
MKKVKKTKTKKKRWRSREKTRDKKQTKFVRTNNLKPYAVKYICS